MNERQRMQYLEAMGIDYYVPKWQLSGAKVSQVCELPQNVDPSNNDVQPADTSSSPELENLREIADVSPATSRRSEPSRVGGIVADLSETLKPNVLSVNSEEPAPDQRQEKVEPLPPAQFSLALWRVGPDIQVLDSRRQGDALPTHALLSNMLVSLSAAAANLPKAEYLNWPMIDREHDKSWPAAKQMVQGFFEGRFSSQPVKTIVLFGSDAFRALVDDDDVDYDDRLYSSLKLDAFSAEAILLPSLSDILYSPKLKPRVWASLLQLNAIS